MRILIVSFNSLGAAGTPGTFYFISEIVKQGNCEIYLCCEESEYSTTTRPILDSVKWICKPEDLKKQNTWNFLSNKNIDVVLFIGMSGWNNRRLQIIPKIKYELPEAKIAIDIKSPPLFEKSKLDNRDYINRQAEHVDTIFSLSEQTIIDHFGCLPNVKVIIYPLGISQIIPHNEIILASKDLAPRVVYMGSLDKKRKVDSILDNCNELLEQNVFRSFDIIGYGGDVKIPEDSRINVIKDIPHEIVFEYLKRYDVGLAWVPSEFFSSSPSLKLYEYMAAGLSVVASPNQAFLEDKKKGYEFEICSFQTSQEISQAVNRAYHKDDDAKNKNLDIVRTQAWSTIFAQFIYPEIHRLSQLEIKYYRDPIGHVNFGVFDNHYIKPIQHTSLQIDCYTNCPELTYELAPLFNKIEEIDSDESFKDSNCQGCLILETNNNFRIKKSTKEICLPDTIRFKNIKLLNGEFECEDIINTELFHGFNRTFRKKPNIAICESRLLNEEAINYLKWLQNYVDVYLFDVNGTPTKRLIKNLEEQLENVTFLGFVDPIARASLYRQSDAVFILNNGKYTEFEIQRIKNRVSISLSHCEVLDLTKTASQLKTQTRSIFKRHRFSLEPLNCSVQTLKQNHISFFSLLNNLDVDPINLFAGDIKKDAAIHIVTPTIRPDFIRNIINNFLEQEVDNKKLTIALNSNLDENDHSSMKAEVKKVLDEGFNIDILFLPPSATPGEVLNTAINKNIDFDWHFRFDDDDLYGKNFIKNQIAIANFYNADFTGKRLSFIKKYASKNICLRSDSERFILPKIVHNRMNRMGITNELHVAGATFGLSSRLFKRIKFDESTSNAADLIFQREVFDSNDITVVCSDGFDFVAQRHDNHTWRVNNKKFYGSKVNRRDVF